MPNIVEILKVKPAVQQTFTINASATQVAIDLAPAGPYYLENVYQFNYFKRLDGCLILGAGIMLPYNYCLSTAPLYVDLTWYADNGVGAVTAAGISLPFSGGELSFVSGSSPGLFLPHPGVSDPTWTGRARLAMSVISGSVSMINNPSTLTGAQKVVPWLRVQHNFPLEPA